MAGSSNNSHMENMDVSCYFTGNWYDTSEGVLLHLRSVVERLDDAWDDDPDLISRFFPVTNLVRRRFSSMQQGPLKGYSRSRWTGIKRNPKSISQLHAPLSNLINRIIGAFNQDADDEGNRRICLITSKTRVLPKPFSPIWPALLLTGTGKYFIHSTSERPLRNYSQAICPIAVHEGVDSEKDDILSHRNRLASYMVDLFHNQFNRRFAFGLIISPNELVVCFFDTSGVLVSPPFDYHKHPEQFCAIISVLASPSLDPESIGLDTTLYVKPPYQGYIRIPNKVGRITKHTEYRIKATIYFSSFPVGRRTLCLSVCDPSNTKSEYVVKDYWVDMGLEGREFESSLLHHAHNKGVEAGIPTIIKSSQITLKNALGERRSDSTLVNRILDPSLKWKKNRVHFRLLMTPGGRRLFKFNSRREFLIAYRDAMQAHWDLYAKAGILHRDIKPENILIVPGEESSSLRGVLIDFDHAIRTEDRSAYSEENKIGTYIFMSYDALDGHPHTFLDDVESFFYVLVYACLVFVGPHSQTKELHGLIESWFDRTAATSKKLLISSVKFHYRIQPWWGDCFRTLVEHFHDILFHQFRERYIAELAGKPVPNPDASVIYASLLKNVQATLDIIETQQDPVPQTHILKECRVIKNDRPKSPPHMFVYRESQGGLIQVR